MTTDDQIKDEKLQYDINREGAKLSGSIKIYQKCTAVPYYFLVNDTTLPSDIPLKFRKKFLKQIYDKIMTIDDQIKDKELQYNNNREAAKLSAFSSAKID